MINRVQKNRTCYSQSMCDLGYLYRLLISIKFCLFLIERNKTFQERFNWFIHVWLDFQYILLYINAGHFISACASMWRLFVIFPWNWHTIVIILTVSKGQRAFKIHVFGCCYPSGFQPLIKKQIGKAVLWRKIKNNHKKIKNI